jgi:ABC-type branched-subunit amino acid transport system substrate-binding protein
MGFVLAVGARPGIACADDAPLVTTRDRAAGLAFQSAMEAIETGDEQAAEERLRGFAFRFPADPLIPRARLELGRLLLARYDGTDAAVLTAAEEALARAITDGDLPVSDRARLYGAIVAFHRDRHENVVATLRSLRGRLVVEEDARLLLSTLAASCERLGNRTCTVEALDRRVAREQDEAAREPLDRELGSAITALTATEANALYASLPADGPAWSRVAIVVLRAAYASGQLTRAAEVARALRAARVTIEDADLRALALHVERAAEVAPYVIGAILPLSGANAPRGQSMLRGLSLGTGIPPTGPFAPSSIQIALRDHGGNPEEAVRAVDALYTLHRVAAIVAPPDEASARAVAARANALGLPVVLLDPHGGEDGAITIGAAHEDEVAALRDAARGANATRIAIVRGADDRRAFLDDAVSDPAAVARLDGDPSAMRVALETMLATRPDAILVGLEARDVTRMLGILDLAMRDARIRTRPILLFTSTAYTDAMLTHARRSIEGAFVAQTRTRVSEGFRARFETRFGEAPDPLARLAFDAASALSAALADGTTDRSVVAERLRRALVAEHGATSDVVVRRVVAGRLVEVVRVPR